MRKTLSLFFILFLSLGVGTVSAAPVLDFGIDINEDSVFENDFSIAPGGSQAIDLYAVVTDDAVMDPLFLQGFAVDLRYDSNLMNVTAASVDTLQWPFGANADFATDGSVVLKGGALNAPPGMPALLASITFMCEAPGTSDLWVLDPDPSFDDFGLSNGAILDDQLTGQVIGSVNQVPIPGAVWLLGSGILGLIGLRRKGGES